jgi:hypothetical protein
VNPGTPVTAFAGGEGGRHEDLQLPIRRACADSGRSTPGAEPTAGDPQTQTQDRERVMPLLRSDELKSHRRSVAKKAAAFRRISRSSRKIRFSFRRQASSSRYAVVRPVRPCVRSARAWSTHLRSDDSVRSRSRLTREIDWLSTRTSRTAWALKSSSNYRRGRRRLEVSAIGRDIVSTFRKTSTKPTNPSQPRCFFEALDVTYHSPITIRSFTYAVHFLRVGSVGRSRAEHVNSCGLPEARRFCSLATVAHRRRSNVFLRAPL